MGDGFVCRHIFLFWHRLDSLSTIISLFVVKRIYPITNISLFLVWYDARWQQINLGLENNGLKMQARSIKVAGGGGAAPFPLFLAAEIFLRFTYIKLNHSGVARPRPLSLFWEHIRNRKEIKKSGKEYYEPSLSLFLSPTLRIRIF